MPTLKPIRQIAQYLLIALLVVLGANIAQAAQGISQYGKPKYPDGFAHFDYVNPNAPRGGTLTLPNPGQRTSFDKFNPFTLRGVTAPGIELMFESLAEGSADEVSSIYGLLAEGCPEYQHVFNLNHQLIRLDHSQKMERSKPRRVHIKDNLDCV